MASRLWNFLTTDIRELASLDTVDEPIEATDAVLGLANVLATEKPEGQKLAPLVTQLDSLLDVLGSPLEKVVASRLSFVSIGTGLLKFYLETTNKEPTIAQSVALISQAAYVATVKAFLGHPKMQAWLTKVGNKPASESVTKKLKTIENIELKETEARRALLYFHESKLATVYGDVLIARLVELGTKPAQASRLADRLAKETNRIMLNTLVKNNNSVSALVDWYHAGGDEVLEKYLDINTYLEEWIDPLADQPVFAENFALKDIYISLKAQPLTAAGDVDQTKEPVVLDQWARQLLNDDSQKDQVMFIQGGPGHGKSVFCHMFADWLHRHEHPRWTPILIRLRDISVLSKDFEETLAKAVDREFTKPDSDWLTDHNVSFLFLLDGFDELLLEGHSIGGLDIFLEQVGQFQEQCARNADKGHRVVITGRTLALNTIERHLPSNLTRVNIAPMDEELQKQWFDRWSNLISDNKPHLQEFLQDETLPEQVRELAQEPLLLYLLAAMYRDGELRLDMFERVAGTQAKVLIYERTLDWVLTQHRAERYRKEVDQNLAKIIDQDLNPELTELDPQSLRQVLQEAGLCVVQSGMGFASIKMIEERLVQESRTKQVLTTSRKHLSTDAPAWRNALTAFYLQASCKGEEAIEFVHQSFGEFLCAQHIANSLVNLCQPGQHREYEIDDTTFCWTIYDLLGCRMRRPEIVDYLSILLSKHPDFDAERLHLRLYDFYWQWSEGIFIDAPPENLPQRKMRSQWESTSQRQGQLGQRQIDIYVGLNVIILLLELHRHGLSLTNSKNGNEESATDQELSQYNSLAFHPNGSNGKPFFEQKLQQIIGVSHCIGIDAFRQYVGPFLHRANLSGADLRSTNLASADLSNADLSSALLCSAVLRNANLSGANLNRTDLTNADLRSTNLTNADLSRADLRRADLRSTNLSNTDFSSANLRRADLSHADLSGTILRSAVLSGTNLSNANLSHANFSCADFSSADLSNANVKGAIFSDKYGVVQWDKNTNWSGIREIDNAIGIPERLRQHLQQKLEE